MSRITTTLSRENVSPSRPEATWSKWILITMGLVFALSTGDRSVLPVLKSTLSHELGVTNDRYAQLVAAFMVPYTAMYLFIGRVVGRLGVKLTLTASVCLLSIAMALYGTAHAFIQLALAQVVLGLAQACVVPAVTVALFMFFTPSQHAFSYAVIHAIQSCASILCPVFVAAVTLAFGWRWAFLIPALVGAVVVVQWWGIFPGEKQLCSEREILERKNHASLRAIFSMPAARALMIARMISDPFWFFFQYWQTAFLREKIGMSLANVGQLAWIPPLVSVMAVLGFGMASDRLIAHRWTAVKARVVPILAVTALAPAAFGLPLSSNVLIAIFLCALVNAMCSVWLSLSAVFMGSLVPREMLASALGYTSAFGCIAAAVFNALAGPMIDRFGYRWPFWIGAGLYPLAGGVLAHHFFGKSRASRKPAL